MIIESDNDAQNSHNMIIESDDYNPDDIDNEQNWISTYNETFEGENYATESSEPETDSENNQNSIFNETFESENESIQYSEPNNTDESHENSSVIQQSAPSTNGDNFVGIENTDCEEDLDDAVEM